MPQTAPQVQPPRQPFPPAVRQPVRVRPLWERDALFKEPQYENGATWSSQDDSEDDDPTEPAA